MDSDEYKRCVDQGACLECGFMNADPPHNDEYDGECRSVCGENDGW